MLIKLAWRNLWRTPLRTSAILVAIIIGVLSVILMIGFMSGLMTNMLGNVIQWQTNSIQIHHARYSLEPDVNLIIPNVESLETLIQNEEVVKGYSFRHIVTGMIASARANRGIKIMGVSPEQEANVTPIKDKLVAGHWLSVEGRNPIVVSNKIAQRLKLKLGSKVVLSFSDTHGDVTGAAFRVRGIFISPSSSFDDSSVYVRKSDLIGLTAISGTHEIAITMDDYQLAPALVTRLSGQLEKEVSVEDWQTLQPYLKTLISSMQSFNYLLLVIFVAAMGLGIVNIMLMSVFERTQEFGVLMAIGMAPEKVRNLIVLEASFLGLTGAGVGALLSLVVVMILSTTGIDLSIASEGLARFGIDTVFYPEVATSEYLTLGFCVLLVSVFSALYPARQIIKQSPIQAMNDKH
ncbi:ABC transporter permease [Vibrio inusitatus NBRC 102082]|uniref:ABC transporter permease n=1 Tax=Vibrio inusitatus NBRC 102082 TaxID=1219070 RepID=A0A4Y3HUQ9_9VIBR|nr:ABC transporter permease [Vibrio inusitatus]GEA50725.1 ABC transporter permease [Vibrio inusitatus NBRC 102082]